MAGAILAFGFDGGTVESCGSRAAPVSGFGNHTSFFAHSAVTCVMAIYSLIATAMDYS
jgi:hypothetical protein